MALADDLRAAKALIDMPEKWCKGGFTRNDAMCIRAACAIASGRSNFAAQTDTGKALLAALSSGNWDQAELARYNDRPTTTHADIMALFDRALTLADENRKEAGKP